MVIDHNTVTDEYIAECENCHHQWIYEASEIIFEPWPHFECPACHEWIPLF